MKGKDREQISEAMEVKYYDDAQDSSTESDSGSSSEDSQEVIRSLSDSYSAPQEESKFLVFTCFLTKGMHIYLEPPNIKTIAINSLIPLRYS